MIRVPFESYVCLLLLKPAYYSELQFPLTNSPSHVPEPSDQSPTYKLFVTPYSQLPIAIIFRLKY
jgi:hypothetical protein